MPDCLTCVICSCVCYSLAKTTGQDEKKPKLDCPLPYNIGRLHLKLLHFKLYTPYHLNYNYALNYY